MKKTIILSLICCTLFVTGCGCGRKTEKIITCSNEIKHENYNYNSKYTLTYRENKLISYIREENYESSDDDLLLSTLEDKKLSFSELVELEHFDFNAQINGNSLKTRLEIDFNSIDKDKLFEINPPYQVYFNSDENIFDINYALEDLKEDGLICQE